MAVARWEYSLTVHYVTATAVSTCVNTKGTARGSEQGLRRYLQQQEEVLKGGLPQGSRRIITTGTYTQLEA